MKSNRRVWFDLDETLIQSFYKSQGMGQYGPNFEFKLTDSSSVFDVFVHPYASQVIEYARQIVGAENVFILTRAERGYALRINELAGFAIDPLNVHDRELVEYSQGCIDWPAKSGGNLLIDDMEYHDLSDKVNYLKLRRDQLLTVPVFRLNDDINNQVWYFKVRAFIKENTG